MSRSPRITRALLALVCAIGCVQVEVNPEPRPQPAPVPAPELPDWTDEQRMSESPNKPEDE